MRWKTGAATLPVLFAVATIAFAMQPAPSLAQSPEDMPVKERSRPEYDAVGIRRGNVFFYPSIGVSEAYNDNVLASESDEESDFITVIAPSLAVRSDGTLGGWRANLGANVGLHADRSDENYTDLSASLGGHYDVIADGTARLGAGYARLHEDRSSPDDPNGVEPTVYDVASVLAGYGQRFNRLAARLDLSARSFTFDNVDTTLGTIDNSDRDRIETSEAVRLSYDILPDYAVFARGTLMQRKYDDDVDRNGFDRDSDGYRLDGGVSINLTGLLILEASAGYLSREYDDSRLPSVDGVAAGLSAIWNVTRLTTVTAAIEREIEETTLNGASGRFDTLGRVTVDHELRRNIIVSAQAGYGNSDFQGISREDDQYNASVSAEYLLSQGLKVSASAGHVQRSSNAAGADFTRNVIMVRLHYGL